MRMNREIDWSQPKRVTVLTVDGESPEMSFWFMDVESYLQFRIEESLIENPETFFRWFEPQDEYILTLTDGRYRVEVKK